MVSCIDRGTEKYAETLAFQKEQLIKRTNGSIPDTFIVVEHTPVITLGARKEKNQLLTPEDELEQAGIDLVPVRRGGGATAHNPGQLVIYPIVRIRKRGLRLSEHVHFLERLGIQLLRSRGITAFTREQFPGIWTKAGKIASVGVRMEKGVTYHGIAINLMNDLSIFSHFVPCGIPKVTMVSAYSLTGKPVDMNAVKRDAIHRIHTWDTENRAAAGAEQ